MTGPQDVSEAACPHCISHVMRIRSSSQVSPVGLRPLHRHRLQLFLRMRNQRTLPAEVLVPILRSKCVAKTGSSNVAVSGLQ